METNGKLEAAVEHVTGKMSWQQVVQRQPYTCVVTEYIGALDGKMKVYTGRGFSKCQHPDVYNADEGKARAWDKARADIARQLVADGWEPEGA